MKLIRSINSAALPGDGCVLTIGNFDAVHIGHREILRALRRQAQRRGLPSVVMTFDPHPQEYFARLAHKTDADAASPGFAKSRLTTTATRFFALRECGVDFMLSLRFNRELAQTGAEEFIRHYLAERLKVKLLLSGDDFRFGARRTGDFNLLKKLAPQYGYEVERFDTIQRDRRRVSSTRIRELLAAGDLDTAAALLGRKYTHAGRVIHGQKRGRAWGFPTLNLAIRHRPALSGIFAVTVRGLGDAALAGVASLGNRPTLSESKTVLEIHLFDYHGNGDEYGKRLCVEFVAKIRDEEKFDDYDALIKRIAQDVEVGKQIMRAHKDKDGGQ